MVGIDVPPKPYTQNANECINSVLKRGKHARSLTLKSIVQLLRSVVKDQEEQVKLSFIASSEWTLRRQYNQFQERVEQFYQMTQRQKNQLIQKFNSFLVKGATLPIERLSDTSRNCVIVPSILYYSRDICEGCRNFELICCNPSTRCSKGIICSAKFCFPNGTACNNYQEQFQNFL